MYHTALEGKLNVVAGGHYSTEVWGVRKLMLQLLTDSGLETEFIDAPTGL
jgi:putative NIF3 family GTP cyclohydrolase 1 type 2